MLIKVSHLVIAGDPPIQTCCKIVVCAVEGTNLYGGVNLMTKYREILRLNSMGFSQRNIATTCQCSRNTVAKVLSRAQEEGITWPLPEELTDADLGSSLNLSKGQPSLSKAPDCEYIHQELAKSGVTLTLLWDEYCEQCRLANEIPLKYTQFCNHYRKFAAKEKATMHIKRKPGEQMEVDWAGQTAFLIDQDTGEPIPVYVFVAALSSSQATYVEGFLSMNLESWIIAHINAFKFFGGVARTLVPDNLKTGVQKPDRYEPIINKTYNEMAEHYGTVVIPARVRKPRDKSVVEKSVDIASTWIIAALRNQQYFSLVELNKGIAEKLDEFNNRPFQKKPGSRWSTFLEEEKDMLLPLPASHYEMATWKVATVQFNYHITVDKMHYSVPYEYIKHQVDVRISSMMIEVFYKNLRVCSHRRLIGRPGQYSTIAEHMPEKHKKQIEWTSERFISWAEKVGPYTTAVIKAILAWHKVEQQGYRACMGVLKLGDKYSVIRLESACSKALSYTPNPSYKNIDTILKSGQDRMAAALEEPGMRTSESPNKHGFTRGAEYYGGTR
jgi:transposase